jgi:protein ImuB
MERSDRGKAQAENAQRSTSNTQPSSADKSVQEILTILHKWGIHTLGQLAALDKEQLGARLGREAIRMWERANGQSQGLLKLVQLPESFEENFEFENEIETAEPLLFILRRFLEQLALRLSAIYLVAKELTLRVTFANKQRYKHVFTIPQPTNDVDLLFRMLHTHLENFRSEHPIVAVALSAQPIQPAKEQFGLFEITLRNPHQLSETLARLAALLGPDRIGTPILEETHRPDAFRIEPFSWGFNDYPSSSPSPRRGEKRPPLPEGEGRVRASVLGSPRVVLRRFRPAASASVLLDENKLAHVRSSGIRGKVIKQRGPYLISGNWWNEKSWARAEWDLHLENGDLVRVNQAHGTWRIDGVYD